MFIARCLYAAHSVCPLTNGNFHRDRFLYFGSRKQLKKQRCTKGWFWRGKWLHGQNFRNLPATCLGHSSFGEPFFDCSLTAKDFNHHQRAWSAIQFYKKWNLISPDTTECNPVFKRVYRLDCWGLKTMYKIDEYWKAANVQRVDQPTRVTIVVPKLLVNPLICSQGILLKRFQLKVDPKHTDENHCALCKSFKSTWSEKFFWIQCPTLDFCFYC